MTHRTRQTVFALGGVRVFGGRGLRGEEGGVETNSDAMRDGGTQLKYLPYLWEGLRCDGRVCVLGHLFHNAPRQETQVCGQIGEVSDRQ